MVLFVQIPQDSFLSVHDEYLTLSRYKAEEAFFVRESIDLGTGNTTTLLVTFWERIYYWLVTQIQLPILFQQFLLHWVKMSLLIGLPILGFSEIWLYFFQTRPKLTQLLAVSLFYSFNLYTLIFWHGNSFSLTLLLCYSLAPLALVKITKSICDGNLYSLLFSAILIFIMSFALYLFIVFVIFATIFNTVLSGISIYRTPKEHRLNIIGRRLLRCITFCTICVPLLSIHLIVIYDTFFTSNQTVNMAGGDTGSFLTGGVLYPLLTWFSWGIYTLPHPQNMFTFSDYLMSPLLITAPFVLYFLILKKTLDKEMQQKSIFYLLLGIFAWMIIFSKAFSPPLGFLYQYLLEHVAIFRIFRSPDNKFGFGAILALSMLIIFVLNKSRSIKKVGVIFFITVLYALPILTGTAVLGQNLKDSTDRIVFIGEDYRKLITFIKDLPQINGYIVSYPGDWFSYYTTSPNEKYLGLDLISKFSSEDFIYMYDYTGMDTKNYNVFKTIEREKSTQNFFKAPIKYALIRRDTDRDPLSNEFVNELITGRNPIFSNTLFDLYQIPGSSIIETENPAGIVRSNPVTISINPSTEKGSGVITFRQSYSSDWILIKPELLKLPPIIREIEILRTQVIERNSGNILESKNDFRFNSWNLQNYNGSAVIYFKTQAIFNLLLSLSCGTAVLVMMLMHIKRIRYVQI